MKRLMVTLMMLSAATSIAAQEPDSSDVFFQHLELGEVVVTGVAGDTRVKEMPAPVAVIRGADLTSKASTNIIQALASEPGISHISTGGGISKPVIRGLGYNRVIVISDGVRQEGQQWGDEHGVEIDGSAVHSVEILKGPASLMYGSDALAGVIIFHPDPVAAPGTIRSSLTSEYQSNNGLAAYSLTAAGNHNGWIWDARFSDKYAGAYRNPVDGRVPNSGFRERCISGVAGKNGHFGYSRLRFSWFHLTPGMVEGDRDPITGELEGDAFGSMPALPFQQVNHYKVISDNTFHFRPGDLKAIIGWQQNRRQEFEESKDESELDFRLNTISYDIRFQGRFNPDWKFAAGVGGMYQRSDNLGEEYLIPDYDLFDGGLFITLSGKIRDWTISGGIRRDIRWLHSKMIPERFEDFQRLFRGFSSSLGVVRPFGEYVTFRANIARGFRAPNLAELGSNGVHEGTLRYEIGNKNLYPENSLQGDLGLDIATSYLSLQVAAFASRINTYIFAEAIPGVIREGVPAYRFRSGLAHLKGGEIAIDVHPVHRLHLSSAFSCVYAREDRGDDLPLIPAPRLFSEIKYEFSHNAGVLNNAFISFSADWNMRQNRYYRPGDTETATPAYVLLGASAGTDVIIRGKKRMTLCLVGSNLTDAAYQSHLSRFKYAAINPVTGRRGIFDMGRNIILRVTIPVSGN